MASIFEATAGKLIGPTTGGTVTQSTNKTTGVTLNAASGQITMNGAELAGAAEATFTVTNSEISSTSVKCEQPHSGEASTDVIKQTVRCGGTHQIQALSEGGPRG